APAHARPGAALRASPGGLHAVGTPGLCPAEGHVRSLPARDRPRGRGERARRHAGHARARERSPAAAGGRAARPGRHGGARGAAHRRALRGPAAARPDGACPRGQARIAHPRRAHRRRGPGGAEELPRAAPSPEPRARGHAGPGEPRHRRGGPRGHAPGLPQPPPDLPRPPRRFPRRRRPRRAVRPHRPRGLARALRGDARVPRLRLHAARLRGGRPDPHDLSRYWAFFCPAAPPADLSRRSVLAVVLISLARGFNADLFAVLFGSILTVSPTDIWLIVALAAVVGVALGTFYPQLFAVTMNEDLARTSGIPVAALNLMLGRASGRE